jgi:hypothetical protein
VYRRILLLLLIFLTACGSQAQAILASPSPDLTTLTAVPISTSTIEPCAFVEATQNLPDLSAQIDTAIKQLQPRASGRAEASGENCVYASSGQSTFSAMETDFYFTINVQDLKDDNELGTWIVNVIKIINALPPDSISGPQAGFVEFTFQTTDDQKTLRVPISQYNQLPAGINPSDLIPTLFPTP